MFAKCVNEMFGLTCDMIENQPVDTVNNSEKCQNCGNDKFSFGEDLKEQIINVEFPIVTHFEWNSLSVKKKIALVEIELSKLNYINQ